jgi:hypothetical protein
MYSGEFDISQPALSFISWLVFFLASHNFPLDQRSAYFGTHTSTMLTYERCCGVGVTTSAVALSTKHTPGPHVKTAKQQARLLLNHPPIAMSQITTRLCTCPHRCAVIVNRSIIGLAL